MTVKTSDIQNCQVLWLSCYPSHYIRAMHCEIDNMRPGMLHFVYVRDEKGDLQRLYERGKLPKSSELLGGFRQWLLFVFALLRSSPQLVVFSGYNDIYSKFALIWIVLSGRKFCFWSDTNLLEVMDRPRLKLFCMRFLLKPIFSHATRLLYIGTRNRDYWIWLLGRPRAQGKLYHMAYPALLMPEASSHTPGSSQDEKAFAILFLGRLEPVKSVDKLIKAASLLGGDLRDRVKLDICGTGSEEEKLKALVGRLSLGGVVTFHGAIPSDQVAQAYSRADLFLLASDVEPWGLVVNEALSAGVPVMCPYWVGAAADLVVDGLTGYILEDNEPATIAAGIERAWTNRTGMAGNSKYGRDLVRNGPWNCESVTTRALRMIDEAVPEYAK